MLAIAIQKSLSGYGRQSQIVKVETLRSKHSKRAKLESKRAQLGVIWLKALRDIEDIVTQRN